MDNLHLEETHSNIKEFSHKTCSEYCRQKQVEEIKRGRNKMWKTRKSRGSDAYCKNDHFSFAEKNQEVLWTPSPTRNHNVPLQQGRLILSWAASAAVLSAGRGRSSFPLHSTGEVLGIWGIGSSSRVPCMKKT